MNENQTSPPRSQSTRSSQPYERLREEEKHLARLADAKNKKEFFKQIIPLLKPLKSYIKRSLRLTYLTQNIPKIASSDDLLDEVVLQAYERYDKKPPNLTLQEWLYRLSNEQLDKSFKKTKSKRNQRSYEALTTAELRGLEEMPITADADGEVWFPEELDDGEYDKRDFYPPGHHSDPETQLERKEEVQRIVRALTRIPEKDRIIFELFVVEGFSKEAVARIFDVPPDEVPHVVERVKAQVQEELQAQRKAALNQSRQAS